MYDTYLPFTSHEPMRSPRIIVVTGIQAAGKSTVARMLAQRFGRGVHIEADVLQQMIVSGGEWITEPLLRLRTTRRIAAIQPSVLAAYHPLK